MKQVLQDLSSGETLLLDCPDPMISKNSIKIDTSMTLISSGTERMLVDFGKSSLISKARQQPERVKMVLDKAKTDGLGATFSAVKSKLNEPIPLGYSNVGVIKEVCSDIQGFKIGDRVVSNASHADTVVVKKNLCALIPDNVDDDSAAFTVVGSIGLQGVRLANPTLGETFVVIGAGLIGLLVIQLLQANGCTVLAVDFDDEKLRLASSFGAETFNPNSEGNLSNLAKNMSKGVGVDGVIITASTKSNDPIKQAAQICRKRGRIVLVGVVGLELDRADFYDKEIQFQVSCSYGPGRYDPSYEIQGVDYPIGYVRWTEKRNFETFLDLLSKNVITVKPLISARYEIENVAQAYKELSANRSSLGIILDFGAPTVDQSTNSIILNSNYQFTKGKPIIGFIGAGNYASRVLIPSFKKAGAQLHSIVSLNGINSVTNGRKAGFAQASSEISDILKNSLINTVVIATKHDTHAKYVIDCLNTNKNVWVEKPLTIDKGSLLLIEKAYRKAHNISSEIKKGPQLMVGFNRRFAPQTLKIKELLSDVDAPKTVLITVNAGHIPKEHWTQDLKLGGGRIVGECCHFIDLMRFLVGSNIASVSGRAMFSKGSRTILNDQSSITLGFEDGSLGTILYLANGASSYPKERIEIFADGKVLQLDNFRRLVGYGWRNFRKLNLWRQDKGQIACSTSFLESIKNGIPCIPINELLEVARVTLHANEILLRNSED